MNEAETRAELIDPALKDAGWGVVEGSRVRREEITLGRIEGGGRRGKKDIADYVLMHRDHKLAVVEAKRRSLPVTEGLAQAKRYATMLQARFAFSTNGEGIYRVDMETGAEGPVDRYPTPDELWDETFAEANAWRDRFAEVPFEDRGAAQAEPAPRELARARRHHSRGVCSSGSLQQGARSELRRGAVWPSTARWRPPTPSTSASRTRRPSRC